MRCGCWLIEQSSVFTCPEHVYAVEGGLFGFEFGGVVERDVESVFQSVAFGGCPVVVLAVVAGYEVRWLVCTCLFFERCVFCESFE